MAGTAVIFPKVTKKPVVETGFYTKTHWGKCILPEGIIGCAKSKTLAEQAAWEYQKSLPEAQRFENSTVYPCFFVGPTLIPGGFTSVDMIFSYFNSSIVRDVSKLHLEALRIP